MIVVGHVGHVGHGAGGAALEAGALLPVLPVAVALVAYLTLAARRCDDPRGWSVWRSASFMAGCVLLGAALVPPVLPLAAGDLRQHMLQHLLIGMVAPLALVLGAPLTLVLRSVPPRQGRRIGRVLRSPMLRVVANPVSALVLNLGGIGALYFTPLYGLTQEHGLVHHLVHLHFLLAGGLFAWVIAGPDPAPRRPSVPARLVVLGFAIAGHAAFAQLLYAGLFVQVDAPVEQLRGAGDLMYFGGDLAELLLAFALVHTWRPRRAVRPEVSAPPGAPVLDPT